MGAWGGQHLPGLLSAGSLLVELGATVPVAGLAVTESQLPDLESVVESWLTKAAPVLSRLV